VHRARHVPLGGALFFRDVKYLVDAVITFAVFFTPVLYPVEIFGRHAGTVMLNPVAPLLVGLSDVCGAPCAAAGMDCLRAGRRGRLLRRRRTGVPPARAPVRGTHLRPHE